MAAVEVKCLFYEAVKDVKKFGKGSAGNQRYRYFSCMKTFQLDYTYEACKPGTYDRIIKMSENNTAS